MQSIEPSPSVAPTASWPVSRTLLLAALIVAATLLLHLPRWLSTSLVWDDFQILTESWPWEWKNLFHTANEHAMPAGRVTTWAMVEWTPLTALPWVAGAQGPLAVLLGLALLYRLVTRECGHPAYGLLAMALFGVSSQYHEAVWWFAASFSILSLDSLLLALLAAQSWRQTGNHLYLVLALLGCAFAPCWFAIGVLAGPLCALYLLLPRGEQTSWKPRLDWHWTSWTPLLGTILFLSISLPLTSEEIRHLEHYDGKTVEQKFDPIGGAVGTVRTLTDNVILGSVGLPAIPLPAWLTLPLAVVWLALAAYWWRHAQQPGLVVLGLGFIIASYLLTYSGRVQLLGYENSAQSSRYNLFAQMGFALLVVGGLPNWKPEWSVGWRWRWRWLGVSAALVVLTVLQFPRAWPHWSTPDEWERQLAENAGPTAVYRMFEHNYEYGISMQKMQQEDLRRIEAIDARCQVHHISAEQARAALGWFVVARSSPKADGWKFLRGCDDSEPRSNDEVRRLLEPAPDSHPTTR